MANAKNRKYDWEAWFKCKRKTLKKGKDYHISSVAMASQIRTAAYKRKISVSLKEVADGSGIVIESNLQE